MKYSELNLINVSIRVIIVWKMSLFSLCLRLSSPVLVQFEIVFDANNPNSCNSKSKSISTTHSYEALRKPLNREAYSKKASVQ